MDIVLKDVSFEDLNYLRCTFVGKLDFYKSQVDSLKENLKDVEDPDIKSDLVNRLQSYREDVMRCESILSCF